MQTVFDKSTADRLIQRINTLKPHDQALWGKMNPYQMIKHCTLSEELFLGKRQYKRLFIGRLFGKMALSGILKDASPMKKNQPTHRLFKVTGSGNFEAQKQQWIDLLRAYLQYPVHGLIHPFFGKMTPEQIGYYVFKHTDHHLRQFNQ